MPKYLTVFVVVFQLSFFSGQAQIQRDCFTSSSSISSAAVSELVVQQSIGQSSAIGNYTSEKFTLRQGFLQPHIRIYQNSEREETDMTVFPNPFRETVQVQFSKSSEEVVRLNLYSATGALLKSFQNTMARTIQLDLSGWAGGLYILQVDSEQGHYSTKIQKL